MSGFVMVPRPGDPAWGWLWALPPARFKIAMVLLEAAAWRARTIYCDGETVQLERGQALMSLTELQERSGAQRKVVRGAIEALERAGWMARSTAHRRTLFTLRFPASTDEEGTTGAQQGTQKGAHQGAQQGHNRGTPEGTTGAQTQLEVEKIAIRGDGRTPKAPKGPLRSERVPGTAMLAREITARINATYRKRLDPMGRAVTKLAAQWLKAKLTPDELFSACRYRISGWERRRQLADNFNSSTLFRFDALRRALDAVREGHQYAPAGRSGAASYPAGTEPDRGEPGRRAL